MLPSRGITGLRPLAGLNEALVTRQISRHTLSRSSERPISTQNARQVPQQRTAGSSSPANCRISSRMSPMGTALNSRVGSRVSPALPTFVSSTPSPSARRFASTETTTTAAAADAASAAPVTPLPTPLNIDLQTVSDIPEQLGYLHMLGLDYGWGTTSAMQWLLEHVHVMGGLPWWGSIAAVSLLFRLAMFLPTLQSTQQSARMQEMRSDSRWDMAYRRMRLSMEMAEGAARQRESNAARMDLKRLQTEYGISYKAMVIPFLNIPFGFGMWRILRGMTDLPVPGLETGGLAWFQDLTIYDPTYVLPIATAVGTFMVFRTNLALAPPQQKPMMRVLQYVLGPLTLVVTLHMPAALQWFFAVSFAGQHIQMKLFHTPAVRRWAGLPPLKYPGATSSHTAAVPDLRWHSPRTLGAADADADANKANAAATAAAAASPIAGFRNALKGAADKARDSVGDSDETKRMKEAQRYERKRSLEEKERYEARKQEARRR